MSIFKEVGLSWKGEEFIVPPEKVMGLIEVIEDSITLEELHNPRGINRSKTSKAFACALRYAAQNSKPAKMCNVTQQDVYTTLFAAETGSNITTIMTSLMLMMVPPEHLQDNSGKEEASLPQAVKAATKRKTTKGKDS